MSIKDILNNPQLSFEDNRIYRLFNFVVLTTMVIIFSIAIFLLTIGAISSFWICLAENVAFFAMLYFHVKGHYAITRYIFFLFAIIMQVYGSLYHGPQGGFDFLFFTTSLSPVLFFEKKWQILSLFILSSATFIAVKILYNYVEPVMPLEVQIIPYFSNIMISSLLLYFGFRFFKLEHLKYEQKLKTQNNLIIKQKESISSIKDQLEELLAAKTMRMEKQDKNIAMYAYLNSHKVRSPLARILGLVNLSEYEDLKDDEKRKYYFDQLRDNAKELDSILTEVGRVLDDSRE